MKRKYLLHSAGTLSYADSEKKEIVVILLHGFGETGAIWKHQADFLSVHFRVIVPDIPGSGYSTILQNCYSLDSYARLIKQLMEKENIQKAALIGHSMGGYISLAFAEMFSDSITKLGLFHSTSFEDTPVKKEQRKKAIQFVRKYGALPVLQESLRNNCTDQWKTEHPNDWNQLQKFLDQVSEQAVIQYFQAMAARPDRTLVLENANVPVLFVIGRHDQAVPFSQTMRECHLPKESHLIILNHSAHLGMHEEPIKSNHALWSFLSC